MLEHIPFSVDDIVLRPLCKQDADRIVEAMDEQSTLYMTDRIPFPYTLDDAHQFIDMNTVDKMAGKGWKDIEWVFAVEHDGVFSGAFSFRFQNDLESKTVEIGYWLHPSKRGLGIMPKVTRAIVDLLFKETDCIRAQAKAFQVNKASIRALEKAGFTLEQDL
ncbi:acyl-CoA N-acyltransferase [Gorgonomyces haynaldii]|nr:acyl-CoA N-acyltransferase [Gorgonomyces haynaldii]